MGNKFIGFIKSNKFRDYVVAPLAVIIAGTLYAISVQIFTVPFHFAPGGVTGIASMIQDKTGFNAGWAMLIINAPLLVIAWIFIGKRFTILTGLSLVVSAVLMICMPYMHLPAWDPAAEGAGEVGMIFAALAAGVIGGAALAVMLRVGGSQAGTDIIAVIIQRKFRATNVAWFIALLDIFVVVASFFVYDHELTPIFLSIMQLFSFSMTSDVISSGYKSALKYEVVTKNPEEISKEIIETLGRGVTCMKATGMYTHSETAVLLCVIRKRQLSKFNEILKKYPDTFAYVTSTSEVFGRGFGS